MFDMRRREFITLLGGAAAAWPLAAAAQQPAMPVIGFLDAGSAAERTLQVAAFRKGLAEAGYQEGQDVALEFRWAEGQYGRFGELAADLVRRRVSVIVTPASAPAALAAKAATTTIPIVFGSGADPVKQGLVGSLNRPGGNVTGAVTMNAELSAKRLGLLQELLPAATRFAVLVNRNSPVAEAVIADAQAAASAIGRHVDVLTAGTNREIDAAFATVVQTRTAAIIMSPDPFFALRRAQIVVLAARHAVPTIHANREDADAGGLMSYGSSLMDVYRQLGIYTGRILKGAKPADMPVLRATKFEFVINLQTAKTLDIEVPPTLLARADEVIE
jgi:putative tryptophan/tyrosine transport system substrate-binding protein